MFIKFAIVFIIYSFIYDIKVETSNSVFSIIVSIFIRLCKSVITISLIYSLGCWFASILQKGILNNGYY